MNYLKYLTVLFLLIHTNSKCQEKLNIEFGKVSQKDFVLSSKIINASTNAVIIADVGHTDFVGNKEGWFTYVFKRKTRIKILNKNGLGAATVKVRLWKDDDTQEILEDLRATAYNLDGSKISETPLSKNDLFEDKLNKNLVDKKFTVPGAKEGSIIEYSYTIRSHFLFNLQSWEFQDMTYPCLWSEYDLEYPVTLNYITMRQGYDSFFVNKTAVGHASYSVANVNNDHPYAKQDEDFNVSVRTIKSHWIMKDIPPLNASGIEEYVFNLSDYIDKISFQEAGTFDGRTKDDVKNSWPRLTAELMLEGEFGRPILDDNFWLDDQIKSIIGNATDPLEQAKKIYYYVSSNYTCTSHFDKYIRTTLRDVFKKREGTVGEINLLLISMLRQKKIFADPVLLSTRDFGFNTADYPEISRMNYVICLVKIKDTKYYIDASVPLLGFGRLPINCYNGHARIISEKDSGSIYFYPSSVKEQNQTTVTIYNDDNGKVKGKYESSRGYYGSFDARREIAKKSVKEYFQNIQFPSGPEFSIENPGIDSLNQLEEPINVHYDFLVNKWKDGNVIYFSPMFTESYQENPFKAEDRKFPIEMPYPIDKFYLLNMEIPNGYAIEEIPKSAKVAFNGNDGFFEYLIAHDETNIQLKCHIKFNRANFARDEYNTLRDFFAFVVNKQSEQIVFKKK
ncbi:MAG: hypothetical protein C5B59_16365 [Bacteroidetes bacterium]|nr:MAG: hypothetical protein C5B59_16365 [Bacteroidota bacterium]